MHCVIKCGKLWTVWRICFELLKYPSISRLKHLSPTIGEAEIKIFKFYSWADSTIDYELLISKDTVCTSCTFYLKWKLWKELRSVKFYDTFVLNIYCSIFIQWDLGMPTDWKLCFHISTEEECCKIFTTAYWKKNQICHFIYFELGKLMGFHSLFFAGVTDHFE